MAIVHLFISLATPIIDRSTNLILRMSVHGDLQEEVYLEQLSGFVAQVEYGKVCRLKGSLYGLKRSPQAWFMRFSEVVHDFGLERSSFDHPIFYGQILKVVVFSWWFMLMT